MTALWEQRGEALQGFRILRIGLNPDRKQLYQRINHRAKQMFDRGLLEETRNLLAKYPEAWPLKSLGYKQCVHLLRGEIDEPSAIAAAQQAHRNYAKRQMTWFRREPEVTWLAGFGDDPPIQSDAVALISAE
jgi:tRNA dimethylallyltransferase